MNISKLFINRPVMTTLVTVTILIFGILSYIKLPVNSLPDVDFPTIQVTANLPGASPETMASTVALPLEKQFSTISGIDSMSSVSSLGNTRITLQFSLERDLDAAAQDVQSAISSTLRQLPTSMTTPPSYKKVNPSDAPIFYLAITSDTLLLSDVDKYAQTILAERLSMINGVAQVQVYGSQKYALRIKVNPLALEAYNISLDEVEKYVDSNNSNLPTGSLINNRQNSNIQVNGQLLTLQDFNDLILTYRNGSPLYLRDIAKVTESVENDQVRAWYNNKEGIVVAVQKQPNTNTIKVINSIKEALPEIRARVPAGININVLFDRSETIRSSLNEVKFTLVLSIVLVIIVIFAFLRGFSSVIIPSLAIPISLIGTFAVMYVLGFSINILSLLALTLCVGFVVDDAIVVLENITRHIENGKSKLEATMDGAKEIGFTVLSMTLSLIAVFLPIFFMGGILGKLLYEFSTTIIISILISGFVSISFTPMLCSLFLNTNNKINLKILMRFEEIFEYIKEKYKTSLKWAITHSKHIMLIFVAAIILSAYSLVIIPKSFLPDEDSGQIICTTEGAQDISFEAMSELQKKVADIILKDQAIASIMSSVGAMFGSSLNNGRIIIVLKPQGQREDISTIITRLRSSLSNISGIKAYVQNVPTIRIGTRSSKSQYQYTLQGSNQEELYNFASKLENKFNTLPGFMSVTTDLQIKNPQIMIDVNRVKSAQLGLNTTQIENTLYSAYGNKQISTIYTQADQYKVILELEEGYKNDINDLSLLKLKTSNGQFVPLVSIANITSTVGPLSISHSGQLPAVTISFDLKQGYSLDNAITNINKAVSELNKPDSISVGFQGTAQAFLTSLNNMGLLLFMAIIVIYIILGILYESFIYPFIILSGLPTAGFGAMLILLIFNKTLDVYGYVGLLMLIGIVKKNAIMIIDFTIQDIRSHHNRPEEAVFKACLIRFRPIMMTTLAALAGALPIALGVGHDGNARSTLGLTIVGGLLSSQLLTLYITPVIFLYLESRKSLLLNKLKK